MKFDIKEEDMIIKPYNHEGPIYIREQKGFFQRIRRNLGWILMLTFIAIPWLPYHVKQAVLLDVASQQFRSFGLTLLPKNERPSKADINKRVAELLDLVQLPQVANAYPHQLSGGQRQRIALARALAVKPKLLLLDEPFGALDAKVRKELRTWLKNIHHELGITSIMVTHDQEEARAVSDEIVVMNQGRVEQVGTSEELIHQPANAFISDFLDLV